MAKRDKLFTDRAITIQVNDLQVEYLEDLAKTGLYGNNHQAAAEIVFRHGLGQLIETGKLKVKEHPFQKDED